jgi:hypothetical protein
VSEPVTRCALHPDRPAPFAEGEGRYCERCRAGIEAARRSAPPGNAALRCSALYLGGDSWRPIAAPGAAHWLGHELDVRVSPGRPACAAGRAARVLELVGTRRELVRELPIAGDLWVDLDGEGCGVVQSVRRAEEGVEIAIRGGLASRTLLGALDFYRDCGGRGRFHRSLALRA